MNQQELETIIRDLFRLMNIEVEVLEMRTTRGVRPLVHVKSPDSRFVIGKNGATLAALNHLLARMLERRGIEASRTIVDVNGYHEHDILIIERRAQELGNRVRTFKYDIEMSPATAYERMVVHALFADDPEITTESSGEGPTRHVVLKYRAVVADPPTEPAA